MSGLSNSKKLLKLDVSAKSNQMTVISCMLCPLCIHLTPASTDLRHGWHGLIRNHEISSIILHCQFLQGISHTLVVKRAITGLSFDVRLDRAFGGE